MIGHCGRANATFSLSWPIGSIVMEISSSICKLLGLSVYYAGGYRLRSAYYKYFGTLEGRGGPSDGLPKRNHAKPTLRGRPNAKLGRFSQLIYTESWGATTLKTRRNNIGIRETTDTRRKDQPRNTELYLGETP